MYRSKQHYIYAIVIVALFFYMMPHGKERVLAWVNGGWKGTVQSAKQGAEAAVNKAKHLNSSLVEGGDRTKEWKGTQSWVKYISPGTTYSDVWPIKIVRWLDGDTVDVLYNQKKVRVRLIGVDTFETKKGNKMRRDVRAYGKSADFLVRLG